LRPSTRHRQRTGDRRAAGANASYDDGTHPSRVRTEPPIPALPARTQPPRLTHFHRCNLSECGSASDSTNSCRASRPLHSRVAPRTARRDDRDRSECSEWSAPFTMSARERRHLPEKMHTGPRCGPSTRAAALRLRMSAREPRHLPEKVHEGRGAAQRRGAVCDSASGGRIASRVSRPGRSAAQRNSGLAGAQDLLIFGPISRAGQAARASENRTALRRTKMRRSSPPLWSSASTADHSSSEARKPARRRSAFPEMP
jgi:hypothetical protein